MSAIGQFFIFFLVRSFSALTLVTGEHALLTRQKKRGWGQRRRKEEDDIRPAGVDAERGRRKEVEFGGAGALV